jgi:RHS repeat-associated protein
LACDKQIFDAFGNQVSSTGSTASALQWQGANLYRTYSPDAGLLQAGARYCDAQVGRFITRDTHLDQHPYIYCGGDPVNGCDPGGGWSITIGFSLIVGGSITFSNKGTHLSGNIGLGLPVSVSWSPNDPRPHHAYWQFAIAGAYMGGYGGGNGASFGGLGLTNAIEWGYTW